MKRIMKNCQELESVLLFKYLLQFQTVSIESLLSCHNFVQVPPFTMCSNCS